MPLLVLTGYPSSGKTTVANRIKEFLLEKEVKDVAILDDSIDSEYSRTVQQYTKKLRLTNHNNAMRSEAMRLLSTNRDLFVIVDCLNYARSQRYELFTVAKNFRTTFGIVFCDSNEETSNYLNETKEDKYPGELMKDLFARYERPNARLSGEKPLFEVVIRKGAESDLDSLPENAELHLQDLYDWFINSEPMKQNASVAPSQKTSTSFIQEVDKNTQMTVKHIMNQQNQVGLGGIIVFPWEDEVQFQVKKIQSLPALMRHRTQFLDMTRKNLVKPGVSVTKLFVDYLSSTCV